MICGEKKNKSMVFFSFSEKSGMNVTFIELETNLTETWT